MYIYSYNDNKKRRNVKLFFLIVLTVVITAIIIDNIIIFVQAKSTLNNIQRLSYSSGMTTLKENTQYEINLPIIIENVKKTTVGISLIKADGDGMLDVNMIERWGMGTGIIVSENGYILTNHHLAQTIGAKVMVTLQDGTSTSGKIVWNEENIDLSIIKIDRRNLNVAELGDSSNIRVGEEVIAIGNPLGVELRGTTTKGIISGVNRTFMFEENGEKFFMEDLIQTDASINPGNSGGPLIDKNGKVIGINTVKIEEAESIGFAVPINVVKPIIKRLENEGQFDEAYLGIYAYDKEMIPYMNSEIYINQGIYVKKIDPYGPLRKKSD